MQPFAAHTERILYILTRTGAEAVEGDREGVNAKLSRGYCPSSPGRYDRSAFAWISANVNQPGLNFPEA